MKVSHSLKGQCITFALLLVFKVYIIFGPKKIMHHTSDMTTKHVIMSPGCLHAGWQDTFVSTF